MKRTVDRVTSLIFTAYAAVALVAAAPLDSAVIVDSGSTNAQASRIVVHVDGSASIASGTSSSKPFTLSKDIAARFFKDLAAARDADATTSEPCVKSASFGSTIRVTWQGWESGDLSCPPKEKAGAALANDVTEIRVLAGPAARPRSQMPPDAQPPN